MDHYKRNSRGEKKEIFMVRGLMDLVSFNSPCNLVKYTLMASLHREGN